MDGPNDPKQLEQQAWEALKEVQDPEIGLDIVNLGLVYGIRYDPATFTLEVRMTLTNAACPMGDALRDGVIRRLSLLPGVAEVKVELVMDPPWTPEKMSPEARAALGW